MAEIRVIQAPDAEHPFAVVYKPKGLPSAPLKEGEDSALSRVAEIFPQLKSVEGKKKVEYGLLHRIDTATSGLLLVASTQESYGFLSALQKEGKFVKYYRAEVDVPKGKKTEKELTLVSRFRPFGEKGRNVKPVFEDGSAADKKKCGNKVYSTYIKIEGNRAVCRITEGYRHQVRAHLAFCGFPICGDGLYNENARPGEELKFEAFRIEFVNPATGKLCFYEC